MMKPSWLSRTLAVILWVGFAGAAFGQSTNSGDISGIVTDISGAAVPGVDRYGRTTSKLAYPRSTSQMTAGVYDTSSIVAGTYKITFAKSGFSALVRSSITFNVENYNDQCAVAVGAVTQEVVVNTDIPLLKTENGEQSVTLSAETLSQPSQVGQDWTQFDILLPGAAGATRRRAGRSCGNGHFQLALRSQSMAICHSAQYLRTERRRPCPPAQTLTFYTQETIQEIQTVTSAFSAQYGVGGICTTRSARAGQTNSMVRYTSIFRMMR